MPNPQPPLIVGQRWKCGFDKATIAALSPAKRVVMVRWSCGSRFKISAKKFRQRFTRDLERPKYQAANNGGPFAPMASGRSE